MKHKTHTVKASGAGKDRGKDRIQTDTGGKIRNIKEERRQIKWEKNKSNVGEINNLQKREGSGQKKSWELKLRNARNKRKGRDKMERCFCPQACYNHRELRRINTKGNGAGQQSDHSVHTRRERTAGESDCAGEGRGGENTGEEGGREIRSSLSMMRDTNDTRGKGDEDVDGGEARE